MPTNTTPKPKQLAIKLAEDAFNGDAHAIVTVDGVVAFQGDVTATRNAPAQQIALGAVDASVAHTIAVQFTNDAYGGTSATDRNLYVQDVLVDGASTGQAKALYFNDTASFDVAATAPAATAPAPGVNGSGVNAPGSATLAGPISLGLGRDTIEFAVSEDAWQGDAQFAVMLDGVQVGGVQSVGSLHKSGAETLVDLHGAFSDAPHTVALQFLNDAWGGSDGADRNLYIDTVAVNGVDQHVAVNQFTNGAAPITVQAAAVNGAGPQTIQVVASEDAYAGDAVLVVSVDGIALGDPLLVTASHAAGATQTFSLVDTIGAGSHVVSAAFVNDAYGGSPDKDRNAYVQSISVNGVTLAGASGPLFSNGAVSGTVSAIAPTPAPVLNPAPIAPVAAVVAPLPPLPPAPPPAPPPVVGATGSIGLVPVGAPAYAAGSPVETVGVGKMYTSIGAAVAAATDGTVILVDAGTYTNDFVTNYARVTLLAVGGRVSMVATVPPPNYKGLITVENDLTVKGFDFSGVHIPDDQGHNGAGIRVDRGNLTLFNDEFDHNQNGLLANPGSYSITIDHSVFNDNGGNDGNGAGNIHNLYIGAITSVTATNSIFENAQVGHEFKSRANTNTINNNQFIDGVGIGTGSYDIDLPNGGNDTVTNNTIIKGPNAENHALVHFGGESIPYAGSQLTVSGNLFEADNNPAALAVFNQTAITADIKGNVFSNIPATAIAGGPASISGNYDGNGHPIQNQQLTGVLPGSTFIATDALPHTVILYGGLVQAVQGGAGPLTVVAQAGRIIAIGGKGGMTFSEQGGSGTNQITTAAGSVNTLDLTAGGGADSIDSEGTDTILAGDKNVSAQLNGIATVIGGAGSDYWSVGGTATVDTGKGSSFFNLGATASLAITGTNDFFALTSNGGAATWNTTNAGVHVAGSASTGAFSMTTYDGTANITTTGGTTGTTLHLDAGGAHVLSFGPDTIYAGSGPANIVLSGAATVYAGTGDLALFGRGDEVGADVYGNGGHYSIDGDTGNIRYHGGDRASTVDARLSNISLQGGAGRLTVNGGSRDTVVGGSGGLVFNDFGNGANTVTTAAGSTNTLNLSGIDTVTSRGADTITLDSGNSSFAIYGKASLLLEDGSSGVDVYGAATVTTLAGSDHLTAHAGATISLHAANNDSVSLAGASLGLTFADPARGTTSSLAVAGPGTATAWTSVGNGLGLATAGDAATSVSADGDIAATLGGHTALHLAAGTASLAVRGAGNEIWAGSGALYAGANGADVLLHGGIGTAAVNGDNSHITFIGGAGAATLTGGAFDIVGGAGTISAAQPYGVRINSFVGGTGTANLQLDTNGSDITFGAGRAAVHEQGWGAADTYHFLAGMAGVDTVENFRPGTDHAMLGAGVTVQSATVAAGSAQFVLSNGAHVTFAGLNSTGGIFG